MKIFGNIELIDLAIYSDKTLIVGDFHIGYEEALNKKGLLVPRLQFDDIIKRLSNIFLKLKNREIDRIVVNGDLKHEFGTISEQEWRHTLRLLDCFRQHCKEIILVKGNHDTILGPIAKKRNVKVVEHYFVEPVIYSTLKDKKAMINESQLKNKINDKSPIKKVTMSNKALKTIKLNNGKPIGKITITTIINNKIPINKKFKKINIKGINNKIGKTLEKIKIIGNNKNLKSKILVVHGDEIPDKKLLKGASTIIIGHEHPAVSVREGSRSELFKAYLIGKWKGKNLIVQPSFNLVTEGTDVLKEELLSPFLKGSLGNFDVVIVGDKLYRFGKLKGL
ncbi:metallophosphoesterase [Candidatus Woesearchaeota archaeon]|nr:metallophosphoesterase [Candidatus Woesearchaeota archaeon]